MDTRYNDKSCIQVGDNDPSPDDVEVSIDF